MDPYGHFLESRRDDFGLLREYNTCHTPAGSAAGGQFCSDQSHEFDKDMRSFGQALFGDRVGTAIDRARADYFAGLRMVFGPDKGKWLKSKSADVLQSLDRKARRLRPRKR